MLVGSLSNWYTTTFNPAVELIDHFVGQVEPQIVDAIKKYQTDKRTYVEVDEPDEDGQQFGQQVERYGNLEQHGLGYEGFV
jgi:hypothetical protein